MFRALALCQSEEGKVQSHVLSNEYTILVYTKPVNIHFHAVWLATQAQDIL